MKYAISFGKKKRRFFQTFSTGIKIGGVGASISYAAFEKEGHFSIILEGRSYCHLKENCHKGYKVGYAYSIRGIAFLRRHSEMKVISSEMSQIFENASF